MLTRQLFVWTVSTAAILAALAVAILAAFRQASFALAVLCGCVLGVASFAGLAWGVRRTVCGRRGASAPRGLVMLNLGKYAMIGVAFWGLLRAGVNGAGLAVGLSIVYLSLTVSGIRQAGRLDRIEEV